MYFDTVLIANRGEIARRVIRTLRRLDIRSVAVYSDADADAPHVREADLAVRIGPAAASASYLNVDAVLAAARGTGANAIHPGYGFLSENAAFAEACAAAGIVFIGPGRRALEVMGDKIRSKEHVAEHGVPVVPGFSAAGMSDEEITTQARRIGLPLLVKPSAGGGGKGMQVVSSAAELPDALTTARRVASASFGDDTLLLERLITAPRHIEVQVLADAHGHVVHLGERECTLQRRHQKVIEEAPSPAIDQATRERLGAAACAAAASVDYRGAGTVEFLVSAERPDEFFFIEMNTRLQVEHPVTEEVTGLDLVEQQLRVAAGEPLTFTQEDVTLTGHSIEARVYAESPARGFLPATGIVGLWRPAADVRVDSAIETGSEITADYDPMIAKVIATGVDRDEALDRLRRALGDTVVFGVDTNLGFLATLVDDPRVRAGDMDTGLIDTLLPYTDPEPSPEVLGAAAAYAAGATQRARYVSLAEAANHPGPPVLCGAWTSLPGWRLNAGPQLPVESFVVSGESAVRTAVPIAVPGALAEEQDDLLWVHVPDQTVPLQPITRRDAADRRRAAAARPDGAVDPTVRAPMPGTVVAVHVADGDTVAAGTRLVTIEAMKMEHVVTAPATGTVTVTTTVGEHVRRDQQVAELALAAESEESA
ncbi:acetyl/propionyl/methylcrotonyl-CoA carboxylase subunit alpha [Microbacterium gorillae]|uniref:acetyl/propionyl/methylcrotonyl-CoA carboxylase subunit alpha n=1 Tax=Microbacterium gorillae TaxID=1231063 RepID=UPI0005907D4E|nr:biotin carboxylase N-terminal domain-containing protein [Microbacterium gorillae]